MPTRVAESYDPIVGGAATLLNKVLGAILVVAFFAVWFGFLGAGVVSDAKGGNVIGAVGALAGIVVGVFFLLPWVLLAVWLGVARVVTATGRPTPTEPSWLSSLITASVAFFNVTESSE
jgi:hypothetical protein